MAPKRSHNQSFKEDYEKQFPVLKRSKKSENHAYCTICNLDFTIAHGGIFDCKKHVDCQRHKDNSKQVSSNSKLTSFLTTSDNDNIIRAEALFTTFILEHNLPIAVSDHARPLFKKMFPDSDIAKKYACARTKTTAIINSLADSTIKPLIDCLQSTKFALATDGSNSNSLEKIFPIVVVFFDEKEISTRLLSLPKLESDSTGKNMFDLLDDELSKRSISWQNCVAFSCDNASSMIGKHKGVAKFILEKNPKVYISKCTSHLLHLTAKKGAKALKMNVEDFLIDVFFYFKKSAKRMEFFKLCQQLCELEEHKILKYVSTRWLSLSDVIDRFLEQWDSLDTFFKSEPENCSDKCKKIKKMFENPMTKLYLLFLQNVLQVFWYANITMQTETPLIHVLNREILAVLKQLMASFISPAAIKDASDIFKTKFTKKSKQKSDADLVIGSKARMYLRHNNLPEKEISSFYRAVRSFYESSCQYIIDKFPLNEKVVLHAEVADVKMRKKKSFSSIEFFLELFCNDFTDDIKSLLEDEFANYQLDELNDEIMNCKDISKAWVLIKEIKDHKGCQKYNILPKIMLRILLIPHSNASCERIFSLVKRNHNDFRANLNLKTLESIVIEKSNLMQKKICCYERKFSQMELTKAKKATAIALNV